MQDTHPKKRDRKVENQVHLGARSPPLTCHAEAVRRHFPFPHWRRWDGGESSRRRARDAWGSKKRQGCDATPRGRSCSKTIERSRSRDVPSHDRAECGKTGTIAAGSALAARCMRMTQITKSGVSQGASASPNVGSSPSGRSPSGGLISDGRHHNDKRGEAALRGGSTGDTLLGAEAAQAGPGRSQGMARAESSTKDPLS